MLLITLWKLDNLPVRLSKCVLTTRTHFKRYNSKRHCVCMWLPMCLLRADILFSWLTNKFDNETVRPEFVCSVRFFYFKGFRRNFSCSRLFNGGFFHLSHSFCIFQHWLNDKLHRLISLCVNISVMSVAFDTLDGFVYCFISRQRKMSEKKIRIFQCIQLNEALEFQSRINTRCE